MLSQILRTSVRAPARAFSTTFVKRNVISDLYLKEVRAFQPTPISAKDAESATKPWSPPATPKIPSVEAEGAEALEAYKTEAVEVTKDAVAAEETVGEDWLVIEEIQEEEHH